jgi:hypothetical protein
MAKRKALMTKFMADRHAELSRALGRIDALADEMGKIDTRRHADLLEVPEGGDVFVGVMSPEVKRLTAVLHACEKRVSKIGELLKKDVKINHKGQDLADELSQLTGKAAYIDKVLSASLVEDFPGVKTALEKFGSGAVRLKLCKGWVVFQKPNAAMIDASDRAADPMAFVGLLGDMFSGLVGSEEERRELCRVCPKRETCPHAVR